MHAAETQIPLSGTQAAAGQRDAGAVAERQASAPGTGPEQGDGYADGQQAGWLARPELLRRRGRRVPGAAVAGDGCIRLRRARRVYAPFTNLPSLARRPLNLRSRRH